MVPTDTAQKIEHHNIEKKKNYLPHLLWEQSCRAQEELKILSEVERGLMNPRRQKVHRCFNTTNRHLELYSHVQFTSDCKPAQH